MTPQTSANSLPNPLQTVVKQPLIYAPITISIIPLIVDKSTALGASTKPINVDILAQPCTQINSLILAQMTPVCCTNK